METDDDFIGQSLQAKIVDTARMDVFFMMHMQNLLKFMCNLEVALCRYFAFDII